MGSSQMEHLVKLDKQKKEALDSSYNSFLENGATPKNSWKILLITNINQDKPNWC